MSPLVLLTAGVILLATPLSVLASIFCWQLYRADPENRLTLVLAGTITATTLAGVMLAIPTTFFLLGQPLPLGGQIILLALDVLLVSPIVLAGYLWLRR